MKNKATIIFSSEQHYENDSDKSRLKAEGSFEKTNDGYVIEYTEPDEGMGKALSKIRVINSSCVHLSRNGLYATDFHIEQGKTHSCAYKTPFGDMDIEIVGKKVDAALTQKGGTVFLCYELFSNSEPIGENHLNLTIKVRPIE